MNTEYRASIEWDKGYRAGYKLIEDINKENKGFQCTFFDFDKAPSFNNGFAEGAMVASRIFNVKYTWPHSGENVIEKL